MVENILLKSLILFVLDYKFNDKIVNNNLKSNNMIININTF